MSSPPETSPRQPPIGGWALLALGFRPFFLLAGCAAVLLIGCWLAAWHGVVTLPPWYGPVAWHSHEMLFGYTPAVIAGFLLTAVRNWSGHPTWTGARLLVLVVVWMAARLLPWLGPVPGWLLIAIDAAFLPLLALSLLKALWHSGNRANLAFVPLLCGMGLLNLLSHLQLGGGMQDFGPAWRVMLDLIVLLIVWLAGRVMPFFTRAVIPGFMPTTRPWVEIVSIVLILTISLLDLLPRQSPVPTGWLWLAFGIVQSIRLHGWFERRVLRLPVLLVLFVGYAWICVGALLTGLAGFGALPASAAVHALTVGVVGVFTLGLMARVALGHTGRSIKVNKPVAMAFALLNLGALARVFGPALAPTAGLWIDLSGALWMLAFAVFVWCYAPILVTARADGKPG